MNKDPPEPIMVNLRRAYVDCRYGQMHLRTAFPSTGGFDERTTLVCLHRCPAASSSFATFLAEIARDRSVYAPDTPGFGESDPPPSRPTVADYAAAIGDVIDALRLREVDVLGHHDGAAIAAELAIARPSLVRRLILVGLPLIPAGGRGETPASPPLAEDGSHLEPAWRSLRERGGPGTPLAQLAAEFVDRLRAGPNAAWGGAATDAWVAAERLKLITQRTLVLRPKDGFWEDTPRARPWLRAAEWHDLPELGPALFALAPGQVAAELRRFLDR